MTRFIARHWFLIGLAAVLSVGFWFWRELLWLTSAAALRNGIVATVLFLMAWPLESSAVWGAVRRPWAASLAFAVNMGLLPLVAWGGSLLLRGELAVGLLVAAAAPCTLASAAVWTRRAGGNDAVALMVTIGTNLTCFVLTPLWLLVTTGRAGNEISLRDMVVKLGLLVVLPMAAAQVTRLSRPVAIWTTRQKMKLGTLAQCGILSMVLIGAVQSAARLAEVETGKGPGFADFAWMVIVVGAVHTLVLWSGHLLARATGVKRPERIAVGFAGSQKTLMVGLWVASGYFGGLTVLPMVAYHVSQLLIDTLVADRLRRRGEGDGAPPVP